MAASKADTPSALVFDGVATAGTAAAAAAAAAAADDADGVDDAAAGTLSPLCVTTDVRPPSLLAPLPTVPGRRVRSVTNKEYVLTQWKLPDFPMGGSDSRSTLLEVK